MNIAIIGIGNWGKNLVREFHQLGAKITCLNNGNDQNIAWLKENYPDIELAKSYEEILDNSSIKGIVIATPISTHFELAKKALLANKDVFVEKPITQDLEEGEELVQLAKKNKKILMVGHVFLYHDVLAEIRKLTTKEKIKKISIAWDKFGTFKEEIVLNLAVHSISIANDLFGKPLSLEVIEKEKGITVCDVLSFVIHYPTEREAFVRINRISSVKRHHIGINTENNYYLWDELTLSKLDKQKNAFENIYETVNGPLKKECSDFIDCIKSRKEPYSTGLVGKEVLEIAEKIREKL